MGTSRRQELCLSLRFFFQGSINRIYALPHRCYEKRLREKRQSKADRLWSDELWDDPVNIQWRTAEDRAEGAGWREGGAT